MVVHLTDLWQISTPDEQRRQDNKSRHRLYGERGKILLINSRLHGILILKRICGLVVVVLGSSLSLAINYGIFGVSVQSIHNEDILTTLTERQLLSVSESEVAQATRYRRPQS